MDINELREKSAKALGLERNLVDIEDRNWHVYDIPSKKDAYVTKYPAYFYDDNNYIHQEDWQPDTNAEQMMMCLEWLRSKYMLQIIILQNDREDWSHKQEKLFNSYTLVARLEDLGTCAMSAMIEGVNNELCTVRT